MVRYLVGRLLTVIPTLLLVMFITFTLTFISPYDPVRMMLERQAASGMAGVDTEENIAQLRAQFGLDQPFSAQFLRYVRRLSRLEMGSSINGQRDIRRWIATALPISAQLGLAALVLVLLVGVPLGVLAALKQNTWVDYIIVSTTLVLRTMPVYVLAPLLLVLLVLVLGIMKVPWGWHGIFSWQAILPVILLSMTSFSVIIRQTRQGVLEVLAADYVRTAKAKGLKMTRIVTGHILRNALIPVVTVTGLIVRGLIVGGVFLDNIFGIPGYGAVSSAAFSGFDYPVIMAVVLVSSVLVIGANIATDLFYPVLDPRVAL